MSIAIEVKNLSKQYRLGQIGTGSIAHDINRWWHSIRGKEDPYLKIGETNDRTKAGNSEYVWSLKDINFTINKGDAVGIIGRNGAGKSTLLKILSRVTTPTTGTVKAKGRIASLLEVGTGFHPDLSGRENIFLNGAILGMRKYEIAKRFDEIVDFAGVERYIDTPVKRYSSGMYVRLAFAVAAYLESEILIVDEVLAVGDAEFQKKCLGKMKQVSSGEGRTVLFVSHNLTAVSSLCKKGVLLKNGNLIFEGETERLIETYVNRNTNEDHSGEYFGEGRIKHAKISSPLGVFKYDCRVELEVNFKSDVLIKNLVIGFIIKDLFDNPIVGINNKHYSGDKLNKEDAKEGTIFIEISNFKILPGNYKIDLHLGDSTTDIEVVENQLFFSVEETVINGTANALDFRLNKLFMPDVTWNYKKTAN